jgi:hypothetical protein
LNSTQIDADLANFCATALDSITLDPQRKKFMENSLEENRLTEKRISRELEDISHLFLSKSPDKPDEKAQAPKSTPAQAPSKLDQPRTPFLLQEVLTVSRELILGFLKDNAAVLEEGLRAIDTNVPCDPFGSIDMVALDSRNQICIMNVDIDQKDESLLSGMAYCDWIIRNAPIVRRMYQARTINFSAQPRLFLVAPGYSPLVTCAAQRSTCPEVICFSYRTVAMPSGIGILFEQG